MGSGLLGNLFKPGMSGMEKTLQLGQLGSLVGGLLGGDDKKSQMGPSPLPGGGGGGGGFRPTASSQLEAIQQLMQAQRRSGGQKFFS